MFRRIEAVSPVVATTLKDFGVGTSRTSAATYVRIVADGDDLDMLIEHANARH